MASSQEFRVRRSFPQAHCPHCPLRGHCHHCPLHTHHFPPPPQYLRPLPQNPHLFAPLHLPTSQATKYNEESNAFVAHSQELEHVELHDEEEDDEPIFVLTDEWREFFAKSEARRKQEKKQGKKGKK
ncbi:uncharacterized protein LOC107618160 isoform X3 [Arachis ipaensis]|uniref:Uncharacterized protein n=1 Tax=Arachis hypogaea TaxID=3818 RepID=A0A6B9V588_ARAHY|nr:uncharacterized protein LOC107618160 isoform X3 [Arachis ipaensis]XP_025677325.1 uncharacterized protein LOC112777219 isoform X3 [Arachis hypogaea]QHN76643.1 uncharacterized protein DS421_19g645680 [Arachis hypogaea]